MAGARKVREMPRKDIESGLIEQCLWPAKPPKPIGVSPRWRRAKGMDRAREILVIHE